MAWHLFLDNAWRVRVAGLGSVTGVELDRAERRLVSAGITLDLAEDLLAACEIGFVKAANEKDEDGPQQE